MAVRASFHGHRKTINIPLPIFMCDEHRADGSLRDTFREEGPHELTALLTDAGLMWPNWGRLRIFWVSNEGTLSPPLGRSGGLVRIGQDAL